MAHRAANLIACLLVVALLWGGSTAAAEKVAYATVRSILVKRCYRCHSHLEQESELRLDTRDGIAKGGSRGPLLKAGDSKKSRLIEVLLGKGDLKMPPEGRPLDAKQIALISDWIDQGAVVPTENARRDHWAFANPQRPTLPTIKNPAWARNPIDLFIGRQHDRHQLKPVPRAERRVLLRRLYLDLIGIPPTPAQLNNFLADRRPGAYERVVERLLASPLYGERWGRHWMDVWRYSDWSGYRKEVRNSQPHIWRWRDWIIESLNAGKGYDRMVVEMLAADEIAPGDPRALRATGFLARNWYKFNRNVWLENTIDHTSKAFLGFTVGCARCHNHMYDPISQQEYYGFRAIFEPYRVRADALPHEPDSKKDGVVRAYDANPSIKTYLFKRGDERYPDKSKVFPPAVPVFFGKALKVEPVPLPVEAFYPALTASRVAKIKTQTEQAVTVARAAHRSALSKLKPLTTTTENQTTEKLVETKSRSAGLTASTQASPQLEVEDAARRVEIAEANLASVHARIAAERARFSTPVADDQAALSVRAAALDHRCRVLSTNFDRRLSQRSVDALQKQLAAKPKSAALSKSLQAARNKLKSAVQLAAELAKSKKPTTYRPLGTRYPASSSGRRSALAHWIADRQNPLTARVAVNQIWMRHFGHPLVERVFDFGRNSPAPQHPQLLDWLALELMDNDWNMKAIHRRIVTSAAYQARSWDTVPSAIGKTATLDPDNKFYWRQNSRRMEAELIRDSVLAVSGQLDHAMGGPELDHQSGQTTNRRSVYYRHAYEKQMEFLKQFDAANVEECYQRAESIVPQQALAMANSALSQGQSRLLAGRLLRQVNQGPANDPESAFVDRAFLHILGRPVTTPERTICRRFLQEQADRFRDPKKLTAFKSGVNAGRKPSRDPRQRARENLVHVLLNHNEFITIR